MITIHRYWEPGPYPVWARENGHRWVRHHPDDELIDWTPATLEPHVTELADGLDRLHPGDRRHRANVIRIALLYDHGGLWVDCDTWPTKPIHPLLEGVEAAIGGYHVDNGPSNSVLWTAEPGHLWLAIALQRLSERTEPGRNADISGGRFLGRCIGELNVTRWTGWQTDCRPGVNRDTSYIVHTANSSRH